MCNKNYIYIFTYTCVILRSNNIFVLLILSFIGIKEKKGQARYGFFSILVAVLSLNIESKGRVSMCRRQ